MKKRIVSLLLATILVIGVMTAPVSAATPKNVYDYLKQLATGGTYDSDQKCYYVSMPIDESGSAYYGIYYMESSKNIELCIFSSSMEVTLVITSAAKLPYTAFIKVYDNQGTTGKVQVKASYNGSSYSSFSSFSGNTSLKSDMLSAFNQLFPAVIEITRVIIYEEKGYTLKDMGLTAYNKCSVLHCFNSGKVTKEPTCVESGVRTYTCVVCGETATESIDPTGEHKWGQGVVITEPTCTQDGVRRYTCTVCGSATKDETVPALGHVWTFTEIVSQPGEEGQHGGTGLYTCTRCGETKESRLCAGEIFTDMPDDGNWAHDPIDWAYFSGITDGVADDLFGLNQTCTRAQVVTFLWRAAGEPEPEAEENPFTDVPEDSWFYKPVMWAVQNGVTDGVTERSFAPNQSCTRAQVVTFLWRSVNGEEIYTESPFVDIKESSWFYAPVLWALKYGITDGISDTEFGAKLPCTRAQVVTFLYRWKDLEPAPNFNGSYWMFTSTSNGQLPDMGLNFYDVIAVAVESPYVPEIRVYTDDPDFIQVTYEDMYMTDDYTVEHNGTTYNQYLAYYDLQNLCYGNANVYVEVEGKVVKTYKVNVPEYPRSVLRFEMTDGGNEATIRQELTSYIALSVEGYVMPEIYTDHPEIVRVQSPEGTGGEGRVHNYEIPLTGLDLGTANIYCKYDGKVVYTIHVTVVPQGS